MPPRLNREGLSARSLKAWATRRANGRDRGTDTYAIRRAAGLCVTCKTPSEGHKYCALCRQKLNAHKRAIGRDACPGCGHPKVRTCRLCKACTDAKHRREVTCRQCGHSFTCIKSSTNRLCSVRCRRDASKQQPRPFAWSDGMRRSLLYEYEAAAQLTVRGWTCMRSLNSRGPFDLIAWTHRESRMIQVKTTSNLRAAPYSYVTAVEYLREHPQPPNNTKWLYVFVLGRGWRMQNIAEWPTDRPALRQAIKKWIRDPTPDWQWAQPITSALRKSAVQLPLFQARPA